MIVRIATVGQFRLDDAARAELERLDDEIEKVIARGDEQRFRAVLKDMLDLVAKRGTPVPVEEVLPSDVILPPPDETLEEARKLMGEEGFVPGRAASS